MARGSPDIQITCSVHLSSAVRGMMENGTVMVVINQIPMGLGKEPHYCTCRIEAEFYVVQIGDEHHDTPFTLFTQAGET